MSLPITQNRTITTGDRVSRADIMSIQDSQIAAYQRGMRRLYFQTIPASMGKASSPEDWFMSMTDLWRYSFLTGGKEQQFAIRAPVGHRIFQAFARVYGGGGSAITIELRRSPFAAPANTVIVSGTATSSGAWTNGQTTRITNGHTIEAGYRYWVHLTSGQADDRVLWVKAEMDRP